MRHGVIKDNGLKDDDGMKRTIAVVAMTLTAGLAACDGSSDAEPATDAAIAAAPAPAIVADDAAAARNELSPTPPIVAGAPTFAAVYPGSVVEGEPTIADGVEGPGGLLTFTTPDAPQAVVDFYKTRAEASGLSPVMAMNQGEAIAYGAGSPKGATIQVVASPADSGGTSVQLSWSAGE